MFKKLVKQLSKHHVLLVVAALAVGYAVYHYSQGKASVKDAMTSEEKPSGVYNPPDAPGVNNAAGPESCCVGSGGSPQPSQPLGQNSGPASAGGASTSNHGLPPSCARKQVTDPAELLPKDENSEWAKLNPMGGGDLQNVNLLRAGYHIGINTVGQSLRNANLQLRSEPANPQMGVGPWNNSTIEPDINRRPLEIGCGPM